MKMLDMTEQLFKPADAEKVAEELNRHDEDWDYVVRHDPAGTGFSFIEVFDEDGELVGKV